MFIFHNILAIYVLSSFHATSEENDAQVEREVLHPMADNWEVMEPASGWISLTTMPRLLTEGKVQGPYRSFTLGEEIQLHGG